MKCDELKSLKNIEIAFNTTTQQEQVIAEDSEGNCYGFDSWEEVYLKDEVDAAIAELKAEINRKEAVGKRWFEQCMEARAENVGLKRALWLARAERAVAKQAYYDILISSERDQMYDMWNNVERKCRAKAEEYK